MWKVLSWVALGVAAVFGIGVIWGMVEIWMLLGDRPAGALLPISGAMVWPMLRTLVATGLCYGAYQLAEWLGWKSTSN